jgi:hypothetical protein
MSIFTVTAGMLILTGVVEVVAVAVVAVVAAAVSVCG